MESFIATYVWVVSLSAFQNWAIAVAKKEKKRKAINGKYVVNSKIMQNFIVSKKYSKMETI